MDQPTLPIQSPDAKPKYDYKVIRPNGLWVSSMHTDVSKTWAKAREQFKQQARPRAGK